MDDIPLLGIAVAWDSLGGLWWVSIPLELRHRMDAFCLAEESKRPLSPSMVAALRREMNVFLEDIRMGL